MQKHPTPWNKKAQFKQKQTHHRIIFGGPRHHTDASEAAAPLILRLARDVEKPPSSNQLPGFPRRPVASRGSETLRRKGKYELMSSPSGNHRCVYGTNGWVRATSASTLQEMTRGFTGCKEGLIWLCTFWLTFLGCFLVMFCFSLPGFIVLKGNFQLRLITQLIDSAMLI